MKNQPQVRSLDDAAARLASSQFGLVSRTQALSLGFDPGAIFHRTRSGRWRSVHRGVFAIAGAPTSWEQELLAAQLFFAGRGVVSHRAAAQLWGFLADAQAPVELSVHQSRSGRGLPGVVVHRVTSLKGIGRPHGPFTVSAPSRTMIDLARVLDPAALEKTLDKGLRLRCLNLPELKMLTQTTYRHKGIHSLREMVLLRSGGRETESELEDLFMRVVRRYGLPSPERQFRIVVDKERYRLDFAYSPQRIAIECDGYSTHSDRERFEADRARDRALTGAGWLVMRFTYRDLTRGAEGVAGDVRRQLDLRQPN